MIEHVYGKKRVVFVPTNSRMDEELDRIEDLIVDA